MRGTLTFHFWGNQIFHFASPSKYYFTPHPFFLNFSNNWFSLRHRSVLTNKIVTPILFPVNMILLNKSYFQSSHQPISLFVPRGETPPEEAENNKKPDEYIAAYARVEELTIDIVRNGGRYLGPVAVLVVCFHYQFI